jgi:hypothetical protein
MNQKSQRKTLWLFSTSPFSLFTFYVHPHCLSHERPRIRVKGLEPRHEIGMSVVEFRHRLTGYSRDESSQPAQMPLAVVWPENAEQVAAVLKLCNQHKVPVTARGGGSSLEGNAIPSPTGIVLSFEKMNKVLEILPEDFQVRIQSGSGLR